VYAAGEAVPDDLSAKVQAGELTREAALEISRLRAANESNETRRQFEERQRQEQQANEARGALVRAADEWVADRRIKDPNFAAKEQPLAKEIAYLQRTEGVPQDPAGVRDQIARAYKAVNDALPPAAAPTPQRRPIRPVTGGQVSGTTRPEPNSTLEVIRAARAGA
jgi:hypothetical protein